MRRTSTISVLGIYNFDNTIFDNMTIPTGMDKTVLVDNLLMELCELEVVYPSAPFLKSAIAQWSSKMVANWTKEYNALNTDYEPLHNYDRTETVTETNENTLSGSETNNDTTSATGSTTDYTSDTSNTLNKVTGYNSTSLQTNNSADVTDVTTANNTTTISGSDNRTITTSGTNNNSRSESIRAYGNIGVTTSQQMLESEIELRNKYNVYDIIINDFKNRFCILVY